MLDVHILMYVFPPLPLSHCHPSSIAGCCNLDCVNVKLSGENTPHRRSGLNLRLLLGDRSQCLCEISCFVREATAEL